MARLVSLALASLDGYVADRDGNFDWAAPDDEVHAFVNDLTREVGTELVGRRMYDVMQVWENEPSLAESDGVSGDFAQLWRQIDKVVYSSTLPQPVTTRTRIERRFEPDDVRRIVATATKDVSVGGPTLAAEAFRAGLVEEVQLFLAPVVVGGGLAAFPTDVALRLELREERRFASGFVFLRYAVSAST